MVEVPEGMKIQLGSYCPGLSPHRKVIGAHGNENYLGAQWNRMNVMVKQN